MQEEHHGARLPPFFDGINDAAARASLVDHLLRVGVFDMRPRDPFVFGSFKTPVYCDMRITLSDVAARLAMADAMADAVRCRFLAAAGSDAPKQPPPVIVGMATGGIGLAVLVAERLKLPAAYIRSAPKDHGLGRIVEGVIPPGAPCLLIEDVIGTGKTVCKALNDLRMLGASVLGVCAVFSYDFDVCAANAIATAVPFVRLVDLGAVVDRAQTRGQLDEPGAAAMRQWHDGLSLWRSARSSGQALPTDSDLSDGNAGHGQTSDDSHNRAEGPLGAGRDVGGAK
jgi:orotate phosphoribosyltransferase